MHYGKLAGGIKFSLCWKLGHRVSFFVHVCECRTTANQRSVRANVPLHEADFFKSEMVPFQYK